MDAKQILETIWVFLNSPIGMAGVIAALAWLLNLLATKKPALWAKYRGTLLSLIKQGEKAIPDETENKSLAKLDWVAKRLLEAFEKLEGRAATLAEKAELLEGISIIHDEAEAKGTL